MTLDGEGARRYGGRWNVPGVATVYLATHPALAVLELLVHTEPSLVPDDLVLSCWLLPDEVAGQRVVPETLPGGWASTTECVACRALGARWIATGALWLDVPSAVLPESSNLLINPAHPAMARVKLVRQRAFRFDARL